MRLDHEEHSLEGVRAALPGSPLVQQFAFERWALRTLSSSLRRASIALAPRP